MLIKQDELVKIWDQDSEEWVVKTCMECWHAHIHSEMQWDTFSAEVDERGWPKSFEEGEGKRPAYVQERCQECGYASGTMAVEYEPIGLEDNDDPDASYDCPMCGEPRYLHQEGQCTVPATF